MDSNPTHAGLRSAATRGASFTTLLGIEDASRLDVPALWRRDDATRSYACRSCHWHGEPLMFDLKDEAEGGWARTG